MELNLKSCPFCGGKDVYTATGQRGLTMIVCPYCGATVSFYRKEEKEKAINAWNKRAGEKEATHEGT